MKFFLFPYLNYVPRRSIKQDLIALTSNQEIHSDANSCRQSKTEDQYHKTQDWFHGGRTISAERY